jgi:hypothetical protein|tara:strand:- start:4209 stop:5165 length:957 start_codon:yes stop_codon:yes gene_type:complete
MTQLINIRNQIIDGLLQSRINPIIQKYNQPKQTGLLNFVNSPMAQDIATGLLAQSGYSTMPQSFGQSLGVAMQNAQDRAMVRDANELNAISTFADIQNLFKGQDQKDRSLDLEEDRTISTVNLQGKQGEQIDSNIEIDQQRMDLDEDKFDLQKDMFSFEKEKFDWEKENPDAKSEIGKLVQDKNNNIIDDEQLENGLKDILGTDGTTATIQNYQYVAKQLFNGDEQKAILFLESSKGESQEDFVKTWIADAKNNPARPDDLGYLTAEANYAWNLSSAKPLPNNADDAEKGTYYYNNDGILALFDGTNYIQVTKPVPPQ